MQENTFPAPLITACSVPTAETRPANDRSRTITPVFQSHWNDPKLCILQHSYGNKNAISSLILTYDRILVNRNILCIHCEP